MIYNAPHLAVTKFLGVYLLEQRVPVFYTDWIRTTGWNVENYQNKYRSYLDIFVTVEIAVIFHRCCPGFVICLLLLDHFIRSGWRQMIEFHGIWNKNVKCLTETHVVQAGEKVCWFWIDFLCRLLTAVSSSAVCFVSQHFPPKTQSTIFIEAKEYNHYCKNGFGFRISQRKWFGRQSTKR
jgi:hypothetical protein